MSIEMQGLEEAVAEFDREANDEFVDLRRLSAVINRLQGKQSRVAAAAQKRGEHQLTGESATSWTARQCLMSKSAAADRLCVGKELARLPLVAAAVSSGQIGFQAASVLCHLRERLADAGVVLEEEEWLKRAREWPLKWLSAEAAKTWHAVDPAGFVL